MATIKSIGKGCGEESLFITTDLKHPYNKTLRINKIKQEEKIVCCTRKGTKSIVVYRCYNTDGDLKIEIESN